MKSQVDLLKGSILPTLTKLALPIMATSFIQMAYNMVDMIWIGRIGSDSVAAVGTAGMYIWLSAGIVSVAKIGGQVKVGHALGANNEKEATEYAKSALQLGIILGIVFGIVCLLFSRQLIGFFNLNSEVVSIQAENYLRVTGGGILFSFVALIISGILMAMGDSTTTFKINSIGLIINMVFDPLFIFGFGPIPGLEATGAAIATLGAQIIVCALLIVEVRKNKSIFQNINLRTKIDWNPIKVMLKISIPAAVQNILFTCISMVISRLVVQWGDTAIAVQKVGSQIESISWMTADGFAAAVGAFVAQNYGAGNLKRVKKGYFTAIIVVLLWGTFCTLLLIGIPEIIFKIFIPEETVLELGVDYLRILGLSQLFMCIEITTAGAFSGIGKTMPSSIEGILLTALRIPVAIILSSTVLGLNGVWWSISISSTLKGIVLFIWFIFTLRKLLSCKPITKVYIED